MIFGISAMIITGMTWTVAGIIMGRAPKKGINPGILLFFNTAVTIAAGTAILLAAGWRPECEMRELLIASGFLFAGGCFNFGQLMLMSEAMQRGPNGIIWAVLQSGLVFPFAAGMIFFGVELTRCRIAGLLLILCALALFAAGRQNKKGMKGWMLLAFGAFLLTGLCQTLNNIPSYMHGANTLSGLFRAVCCACGIFAGALTWSFAVSPKRFASELKSAAGTLRVWKYVLIMQSFSLITAYLLLYPGMDALARSGAGSIAYPVMVGSCIAAFSVISFFGLKERHSPAQYAAILLCVCGIAVICM